MARNIKAIVKSTGGRPVTAVFVGSAAAAPTRRRAGGRSPRGSTGGFLVAEISRELRLIPNWERFSCLLSSVAWYIVVLVARAGVAIVSKFIKECRVRRNRCVGYCVGGGGLYVGAKAQGCGGVGGRGSRSSKSRSVGAPIEIN